MYMQLRQVIKPALLALATQLFYAQTPAQGIYLVPGAGIQMLRAKNTLNEYKTGKLFNNSFYLSVLAGIGVEYQMKDSSSFSIHFQNGHTGISMGMLTNNYCNQNGSYTTRTSNAFSYQDYRFLLLYKTKPLNRKTRRSPHININVQTGLGLDFKSSEWDSGKLYYFGTTPCTGEVFYLADSVTKRNKVALVLPVHLNFDLVTRKKRSIQLSFFYYFGITPHIYANIDYAVISPVTRRERAGFVSYGTTYGVKLSYPIKLFGVKKKT
jgi:hypothetical protein